MPLFLVVATDANGDNLDFFVRAADPISALTYYNSKMHEEFNDPEDKPRIFTTPSVEGEIGVIDWEEIELTV